MFILKIDSANILATDNKFEVLQATKNPESVLLKSIIGIPESGQINNTAAIISPYQDNAFYFNGPAPLPLVGSKSGLYEPDDQLGAMETKIKDLEGLLTATHLGKLFDAAPKIPGQQKLDDIYYNGDQVNIDLVIQDLEKARQAYLQTGSTVNITEICTKRLLEIKTKLWVTDLRISDLEAMSNGATNEDLPRLLDYKKDLESAKEFWGKVSSLPPRLPSPPPTQGGLLEKINTLSDEYIESAKKGDPVWMKSNELFEALSKYMGIAGTDESFGKGFAIGTFFTEIMKGISQDPNNDGKLDHDDVLSLWNSSNGFLENIKFLSNDLFEHIGYKKVPQLLLRSLDKYTNVDNNPLKEKELENFFNDKVDITGDGKIDYQDVIAVWNGKRPDYLLGKIQELSKNLLAEVDPLSHTKELAELGKNLAEYLNTGYFDKRDSLFEFFGNKKDLNGDGQIDYKDIISAWKSYPPFGGGGGGMVR